MRKTKKYRYDGRNGILTTHILLDGISYTELYELVAEPGMVLTDGERVVYTVTVYGDNLSKWVEIPEPKDNSKK